MSKERKYLLDADSFIRSKREHYAFDFCPGFWDALLKGYRQNKVASIIPVKKELLKGRDALADWIRNEAPDDFFEPVEIDEVQTTYAEIVQWIDDNDQYTRAAKQNFLSGADPWLVAHARSNGFILVTYEVSSPESRALIKLPDVARHFSVRPIPPYVMLRELAVTLKLER